MHKCAHSSAIHRPTLTRDGASGPAPQGIHRPRRLPRAANLHTTKADFSPRAVGIEAFEVIFRREFESINGLLGVLAECHMRVLALEAEELEAGQPQRHEDTERQHARRDERGGLGRDGVAGGGGVGDGMGVLLVHDEDDVVDDVDDEVDDLVQGMADGAAPYQHVRLFAGRWDDNSGERRYQFSGSWFCAVVREGDADGRK